MNDDASIWDAIYRGNLSAVKRLIDRTDVNLTDDDGRTLLMNATAGPRTNRHVVSFLIDQGADVNAVDSGQGWTALHFAARGQMLEVVQTLLDCGAVIDAQDVFGNTPLWRCLMASNRDISVAKALLCAGADPDLKNNHGVSPRDILVAIGEHDLALELGGDLPESGCDDAQQPS